MRTPEAKRSRRCEGHSSTIGRWAKLVLWDKSAASELHAWDGVWALA
jgi:hypothetical protein